MTLSRFLRPLVSVGVASLAVAAFAVIATTADSDADSGVVASTGAADLDRLLGGSRERATERRTTAFIEAFEREDAAEVRAMLHPDATHVNLMGLSGDRDDIEVRTGVAAVMSYYHQVFGLFDRIRFAEPRVSVVDGGRVSFVEAEGEFVTTDGRPYENVYVFRLDWRTGRVAAGIEYANPITFCQTFPVEPCPAGA